MQNQIYSGMMRLVFTILTFVFFGFVFMSCDSNRYYEQNEAIKNNTWHFNDAKVFEIEIEDSLQAFNFYINVRNTVDYEFANLYFFIQSEIPDGIIAIDTVECQLADYQGKWLGSGRGGLRDNSFILRQNMRFLQNGTYKFLLKHGMRHDSLKGIADVGIRLERVE
ncbi:MAG: gliding motility lipoprotein GldH [Bacteroidales bacterium]|jgi:gliding motility-associated lipoprotein GldH|nr:gliding motility lipoprotein GldH [Bacteroidales bacterium]